MKTNFMNLSLFLLLIGILGFILDRKNLCSSNKPVMAQGRLNKGQTESIKGEKEIKHRCKD